MVSQTFYHDADVLLPPGAPALKKQASKFSLRSFRTRTNTGANSTPSTPTHLPSPPSSTTSSLTGVMPSPNRLQRARAPASPLLGPDSYFSSVPSSPLPLDEKVRGGVKGKAAQLLGEEVVPSGKAARILGMEKRSSKYAVRSGRTSYDLSDESDEGSGASSSCDKPPLPRSQTFPPSTSVKPRAAPPPALKLPISSTRFRRAASPAFEIATNRPDSGSWTVSSVDFSTFTLPPDFYTDGAEAPDATSPPSPNSFLFPSAAFEDSPVNSSSSSSAPSSARASPVANAQSPASFFSPSTASSSPSSESPRASPTASGSSAPNRRGTIVSRASSGTRRFQRGNALEALEGRRAIAQPRPLNVSPTSRGLAVIAGTGDPRQASPTTSPAAGSSFLEWSDSEDESEETPAQEAVVVDNDDDEVIDPKRLSPSQQHGSSPAAQAPRQVPGPPPPPLPAKSPYRPLSTVGSPLDPFFARLSPPVPRPTRQPTPDRQPSGLPSSGAFVDSGSDGEIGYEDDDDLMKAFPAPPL